MGRFKAPSLRNVALTAPYMHDGSIATLDEGIAHYESGGRTIAGENKGIGADNPLKIRFVTGFTLTPQERADPQSLPRTPDGPEVCRRSPVLETPGRRLSASN